jgi:uncharacterized protein (TIGR02646 family)
VKRVLRRELSQHALSVLARRQSLVDAAEDPAEKAKELWHSQNNKAFREIRTVLRAMASGLERCMYCEDSAGTAIEHFRPKTGYPGYAFSWLNYLLACSHCNSNAKRDRFPLDNNDEPLLIEPSVDDPLHHLGLAPTTGIYVGLDLKGETSVEVFGLNRTILQQGRRNAWLSIQLLVEEYAARVDSGNQEAAERVRSALTEHPFAGLRLHLATISQTESAAQFVSASCLQALHEHPELCM